MKTDFLRFYCYQLRTFDCDPAIFAMRYLFDRFEFNLEQRFWLCWLYANTYQLPTAWVMWNEFPDFRYVDVDRLDQWNQENRARLPYQKDQKWHRGQLARNFRAYKAEVGHKSQANMWQQHLGNFASAMNLLTSRAFPGFGRYTSWFYLQALSELCWLDLQPTTLYLREPSSKVPREGLSLAFSGQSFLSNRSLLGGDWETKLERFADQLINRACEILHPELPVLPVQPNRFSLETSLCAYAKLPRGGPKGRYLGYYLDRFAEDIVVTSSHNWWGVDWSVLWDCRKELLLPSMEHGGLRQAECDVYPLTGQFCSDLSLLEKLDTWYLCA